MDKLFKDWKNISWHALVIDDVFKKLKTSGKGLNSQEAARRQLEFGPNRLPARRAPSFIEIFFHQFLNPLIYILLIAASVALFLKEIVDAIFIFGVILLNSLVGAWQESKAEKSAVALQNLLKIKTLVRRDGQERSLDAEELAIGDIVFLTSGDKVPADIRIFEAHNLSVDEAFLTGESSAINKNDDVLVEKVTINEKSNLLFAGSTILSGRASGVVIDVGLGTEVGKIADIIASAPTSKPPLIIRMEQFTKKLSFIILFLCFLLALLALGKGMNQLEVFFLVTALAVSAIPEGLPVALTVALSVATVRMSRRRVIVRKLTAVEALGSCTVIASDKTGTLTLNQQTASLIYLASGAELSVSGLGYNGLGKIEGYSQLSKSDKKIMDDSLASAVLANEAKLWREKDVWNYYGDQLDVAFLALAYKAGFKPGDIAGSLESLLDIPYESERRYAAKIYLQAGQQRVAIKGALDKILSFCSQSAASKTKTKFNKESILKKGEELAARGYRVLALADGKFVGKVPAETEDFLEADLKDLRFLSLVCFIDPLHAECREAISTCRQAGIDVVMITGDHPATALFIARELGIAKNSSEVVTGDQISDEELTPEFISLVERTKVFARVSPLQKVKIVKALSSLGHFVAVTGDGVNDAPALKQASIGVAMGSGTDVAKEIATMIVTDDNFASIVGGIEEGRFAYANVRKVVYFLISSGAAEIILFMVAILVGLPLPLFAAQLLWLNVVTNGIQDIALSFEAGEAGAMKQKPRPPREGIFNRNMTTQTIISGLVIGLVTSGTWYYLISVVSWSETEARNFILMLLVLFQNIHVFNCRSESASAFKIPINKNYLLILGVLLAQGLHIFATYNPFFQKVLQLSPISLKNWLMLLAISSSVLWAMEIYKWWLRRVVKK